MKSRLPKEYQGGGGNLNSMIKQAQKMQEEMGKVQEEIDEMTFTATSGGSAVSVTVTGKKEVSEVVIEPEVVDPEDVEMLQDLIMSAVNEALRKAEEVTQEKMSAVTGGMNMPGIM